MGHEICSVWCRCRVGLLSRLFVIISQPGRLKDRKEPNWLRPMIDTGFGSCLAKAPSSTPLGEVIDFCLLTICAFYPLPAQTRSYQRVSAVCSELWQTRPDTHAPWFFLRLWRFINHLLIYKVLVCLALARIYKAPKSQKELWRFINHLLTYLLTITITRLLYTRLIKSVNLERPISGKLENRIKQIWPKLEPKKTMRKLNPGFSTDRKLSRLQFIRKKNKSITELKIASKYFSFRETKINKCKITLNLRNLKLIKPDWKNNLRIGTHFIFPEA